MECYYNFILQLSAYASCDISATLVMAYLPLDTNIFTILFLYVIIVDFYLSCLNSRVRHSYEI
jgi:hypothetical protein